MRSFSTLLAVVLGGCTGGVLLPAVPGAETGATEVLVFGIAGGAPEAHYVIDLRAGAPPLRFELPDEARRFEAFVLAESLDVLGAEAGRDTLTAAGQAPETFAAYAAEGDPLLWTELTQPEWASVLRFAGLGARSCLVRGGCLVDGVCRRPCAVAITPLPPAPPEAPRMSCPPSWSSTPIETIDAGANGAITVSTCAPAATALCTSNELHRPSSGCTSLTGACPDDTFLPARPGAVTLYVASGSVGGTGARDAPLGSLNAALDVAPAGAQIMIGAGRYPFGARALAAPVELIGACASAVRLEGVLRVATGSVALEGLTLAGTLHIDGGEVSVRGVAIETSAAAGIELRGGRLSFERLRVAGPSARSVDVRGASRVGGTGLELAGAVGWALAVVEGSEVAVAELEITSTGTRSAGFIQVEDASLVVERGLLVAPSGIVTRAATVRLSDVVLRGANAGPAIQLASSSFEGTRLWVDGAAAGALSGSDNAIVMRDSVLKGAGQSVISAATSALALERVALLGPARNAINASGGVTLSDVIMHGLGSALVVANAEPCRGDRLWMSELGREAAYLRKSRCTLQDVTIHRSGRADCVPASGVFASQSTLVLDRLAATDTFGTALKVESGSLVARDLDIVRPMPTRPCLGDGVSSPGTGIEVDSSDAALSRFRVRDASYAGLALRATHPEPVIVRAHEGELAGGRYGLELSLDDFDFASVLDQVDFSNNSTPLFDTTAAP